MLVRGGRTGRTPKPPLLCCFCSSVQSSIAILASHLRWCAHSKARQEGMASHHHIIKQNLHRNPFLLNLLLHVYGECAALTDAQAIFDVCHRDVFSYNFMIIACTRAEDHSKAVHIFFQMHLEGALPDRVTYAAVVSALASLSLVNVGKFLHACILQSMHVTVATAIIHMYGKCGSLHDAQVTFQHIHVRDVVAWNCILGVHVDYHMGKEALVLYEQMEPEGIVPDKVTFICLLSACGSILDLHAGELVHIGIVSRGFEIDTAVGNALVSMYAKSGSLGSAQLVFEKLPVCNVVSWNAIIGAHAQENDGIEALNLFTKMQGMGIEPNKITFLNIISACAPQDALHIFDTMDDEDVVLWNALLSSLLIHKQHTVAIQLFNQMQLEGVMPNKITFITLVSVCSCEQAFSLRKCVHVLVLGSGQEHDTIVGNALINMYHNCCSFESAESIFNSMASRTVVTWTIIISVLTCNEKCAEVVQCFDRMLLEGLLPDKFVYASVLDACGLTEGQRLHTHILAMEFDMDVVLGTALLNMYGKCGDLRSATVVFNQSCKQNTISYNAMITACTHHGQAQEALALFHQMQEKNITPDSSTYVGLLSACSHSGLLEEGIHHILSMQNNCDLLASVEHYNCIIDLIARAGQVMEAEYLISMIHVIPTVISYRTLLAACRKSADIVYGQQAASQAFILDPDNEGCYFLLSRNMCATVRSQDYVT